MAHFSGNEKGCNIHTIKAGGRCSNAGAGHCTYAENAPKLAKNPQNAHHILPIESVNAYPDLAAFSSYIDKINECYKLTKWCINQPPNIIALPRKRTYRTFPAFASVNLPCHNLGHIGTNGYNDEVMKEIENKIWAKIKKEVDKAKQDKAHFTPVEVAAQFKSLEAHFRSELHGRGLRRGGTSAQINNQNSATNLWWIPFSMAKLYVAFGKPLFSL
jgi:hypothetical protein